MKITPIKTIEIWYMVLSKRVINKHFIDNSRRSPLSIDFIFELGHNIDNDFFCIFDRRLVFAVKQPQEQFF